MAEHTGGFHRQYRVKDTPPPSILIVDDHDVNIELMTSVMDIEGYNTISSTDPNEALRIAEELSPDIAVLDVMMPGMNGYELCRRLKAGCKKRFFPVILVTGLHQLEDKAKGLEAGAAEFFTKPFSIKELVYKIRSLLEYKRVLNELEQAEEMILALTSAVESKCRCSMGHSERVSSLSYELARIIGVDEAEALSIRKAALLHDIGKVCRGLGTARGNACQDEDGELAKRHPAAGAEFLSRISSFKEVIPAIRSHHERWDGAGVPEGLRGEGIPLGARVISIADSFDRIASKQPAGCMSPAKEAIRAMKVENSSGQWDSELLSRFLEMLEGRVGSVEDMYTRKP
ncbi:MAG: response regulator [Deltaproteobacteria bacterium]|nr:response regulator [Deltaproteobacteria bacterium]